MFRRQRALLCVLTAIVMVSVPSPAPANDGGGGAPEISTPSPKTSSRGQCAKLASLKRQLAGAEDEVRQARTKLAVARENLEETKAKKGSIIRNVDEAEVKRATDRLGDARLGRDRLKSEVDRATRACA